MIVLHMSVFGSGWNQNPLTRGKSFTDVVCPEIIFAVEILFLEIMLLQVYSTTIITLP